jgi:glycosyltransferase involved in cell wall biosynthesis
LWIADCGLQIVDCRLWIADCGPESFRERIADWGADFRFYILDYRSNIPFPSQINFIGLRFDVLPYDEAYRMKIAVNTRLLLNGRLDGIGRFADESLRILTGSHPEHEFYFFFDRPWDERFVYGTNVHPVAVFPQARHPLLFLSWFEASLPLHFSRIRPDLFLSPDGFLSLSTRVPSVAVIHDLNFEHFPADVPYAVRMYYRNLFPRFARKASRIATVSEYSKADIARLYSIPEDKIDVVYNGAGAAFRPLPEEERKRFREKFAGGKHYFFFVGTLHPRKNLVNLFRAFDRFRESDTHDMRLLIAGARMWWTDEIRLAYEGMKHRDDVIFTGRVSDSDLAGLMASALALTYVSWFEGFGIPILEAFGCDTPVITSNITSMPEVAGDAALLTDPHSVDSIASAMQQMAGDSALRERLIASGRTQREKFSWELTAGKLWNCMENVLEKKQK